MPELTALERDVMAMFVVGSDPAFVLLRRQLELVSVVAREFTGVGFFTKFQVPASAERVHGSDLKYLSDVYAEIKGLAHGARFVLFIENGGLDCLECSTTDEKWPDIVEAWQLSYIDCGQGSKERG